MATERAMDEPENYCDECGGLQRAPGTCVACVTFELIELTQGEAPGG